MQRVLHVIGKMDRAGAETILMNIYRNVNRDKLQFDFLVFSEEEGDYDKEIESMGGRIYRSVPFKGYNYFEFTRGINKFFREHPYKIVHGHIGSSAPIYLKIAKKNGAYAIAHSHATNSNQWRENLIFQVLSYRVRYIADYFFACSRQAGIDRFGIKVVKSDQFTVLNNGIDSEKYRYTEERHTNLKKKFNMDNKLIIGHVGRFVPVKNHRFVVEVFEKIHEKEKESVLVLAGRGEEEANIKELVAEKGLEKKVLFLGVRNDIADIMNLFDVFLFPSFYEGLGIVGIEAQAAGLPCFFSENIPQEAIMTENVWRYSLDAGAEKWAKSIVDVVQCYERKDTKKYIEQKKFDIKGITAELEKFYLKQMSRM